jgi:hypothetical protein
MLTTLDTVICVSMAMAAVISAASFSIIVRYLFARDLADRNQQVPDIRALYTAYIAQTRRETGRIGGALWVHSVAAGLFISIGVGYTIYRFILPRLL